MLDVHHLREPNWERLFSVIKEELLVPETELVAVCRDCHREWHAVEQELIEDGTEQADSMGVIQA